MALYTGQSQLFSPSTLLLMLIFLLPVCTPVSSPRRTLSISLSVSVLMSTPFPPKPHPVLSTSLSSLSSRPPPQSPVTAPLCLYCTVKKTNEQKSLKSRALGSFLFFSFLFFVTPAVVSRSGNYKDRPASTCSHTRTYIHTVPVYSRTRTKPCSQKHTCAPFLHTRSHASHCSFFSGGLSDMQEWGNEDRGERKRLLAHKGKRVGVCLSV